MNEEERSFKQNLDLLIRLFKKLKERTPIDQIPGIDKSMYENFDIFLRNYETMKDQISEELLMHFGEPMKKMISDLVKQLKKELNEDIAETIEIKSETRKEIELDIAQIDELLKNPGLSGDEINRLLDERTEIKKSKNKKQDLP